MRLRDRVEGAEGAVAGDQIRGALIRHLELGKVGCVKDRHGLAAIQGVKTMSRRRRWGER